MEKAVTKEAAIIGGRVFKELCVLVTNFLYVNIK
jgi:hypothetical protein